MTIAGDLTLVATDPKTGKFRLSVTNPDAAYAGAHLIDLIELGRLAAQGEGRKVKVAVVDRTPTGQPDLDHALSRLKKDTPVSVGSAIGRLGHQGRKQAYAALEQAHRVRSRSERVLMFDVTRYDVLDTDRRAALRRGIRAVLVDGAEPDATTGSLIALLSATDHLKLVIDKPDLKAAKARAKAVTAGDWASDAVRHAMANAEAAMMAAIIASTVAVGGASSS